ncbi:MAG: hypothetical protein U0269_04720 [Polyangiales bacterium]
MRPLVLRLALALSAGWVTTVAFAPVAQAQTASLVVAFPFEGNATEDLLDSSYLAARAALVARGATVPERTTVRAALPVAPPTDTNGIVAFGRSMGGTHVLTGRVTPLTGQYTLELRLYDVSNSRSATVSENVGLAEETEVIARMVAQLFAPGAMQPSPEERARLEAEQRRLEEERRAREEQQRREQEEARRREQQAREQEAQRRAEAERVRQLNNRFAAGGVVSASLNVQIGTRLTAPVGMRPAGAPAPTALAAAFRAEASYAVLARYGLEVGGTLGFTTSPSVALLIAPVARLNLPARGAIPLRGSAGLALGLYASTSGNQVTTFWGALDLRAEYDIVPQFTVVAGGVVDFAPGALTTLGATLGVRLHFGDPSPTSP